MSTPRRSAAPALPGAADRPAATDPVVANSPAHRDHAAGRPRATGPRQGARPRRISAPSAALLALGGLGLLSGLDAAMVRLGLPAPVNSNRLAEQHGILLVLGFVGTVIALERAVALGKLVARLAPLCLGAGAVTLVFGAPLRVSGLLFCVGCAAQIGIYLAIWHRQPAQHVVIQAAGAVPALGSAVLWTLGVPLPSLLTWWAAYLVLTIAGERLELARFGHIGAKDASMITGASIALAFAPAVVTLWPRPGVAFFAISLAATAALLLRRDIALRMVRTRGVTRFMAACLLAGYVWILAAAAIWFVQGPDLGKGGYDAAVHAIFIGFVLSMIFAHAPMILPAVLRVPVPYHPTLWLSAVTLHLGLAVRLVGGDLYGNTVAWQVGGMMNIVAVLGFMITAATTAVVESHRRRRTRKGSTAA